MPVRLLRGGRVTREAPALNSENTRQNEFPPEFRMYGASRVSSDRLDATTSFRERLDYLTITSLGGVQAE